MKPIRPKPTANPDARALAEEILGRVERAGAYASILLEAHARRLKDVRDIALLHEIVYGVLRNRSALDHGLAQAAQRPVAEIDEDLRPLLRCAAYSLWMLDRVPDYAVVDGAVARTPYRAHRDRKGFVNAVLRRAASAGAEFLPKLPPIGDVDGLATYCSHPTWWVDRSVDYRGWEATVRLTEANNQPAPTVLRADPRHGGAEDLMLACRNAGLEVEAAKFSPNAVRVLSGSVTRSAILEQRTCWPQDEASQLVVLLLGPPGDRVADLCAAPGGKTLQIASLQEPGSKVLAFDRHAGRLEQLRKRAEAAGFDGIEAIVADCSQPTALAGFEPFAQILVDAPCSGTGTLRRHPEIRWRLAEADLPRFAARQGSILDTAASRVVPNGVLVYSVCSVEPEEGSQVVKDFLIRHSDFRLESGEKFMPTAARVLIHEGALATSPLDGGIDGFFAARFRRAGSGTVRV